MIFDILLIILLLVGFACLIFLDEQGPSALLYIVFAVVCVIGELYNMSVMVVTDDMLTFSQEQCDQNGGIKMIYFGTVTCNNGAHFEIVVPYQPKPQQVERDEIK